MAHVKLDSVTKTFGQTRALRSVTLEIEDGQFFVLLGPTGAGKTTTLRLIAGLERADRGSIQIDHQNVDSWGPAERDVALVLQQYSLYPRYTARQNLEFPLKPSSRRLPRAEIDARVTRAAQILRVEHLLDRKVDGLSGGEMQRVAIGRAIVRRPKIFLMDEPLSNLDAKLREALRAELKDLKSRLGATFLFVTHDQVEAMSMGDRIAVLNNGRIVQVGTPQDIYSSPRDVFVAGFLGSPAMNLIKAEVRNGTAIIVPGQFEMALRSSVQPHIGLSDGAVTLGIRPEDVHVGDSGPYEATVHHVENHGVEKIVTLRIDHCTFRAAVPAAIRVAVDEPARFDWNQERMHAFDARRGHSLSPRTLAQGAGAGF
jgi:multiple sugar transport system ATP-binding protein